MLVCSHSKANNIDVLIEAFIKKLIQFHTMNIDSTHIRAKYKYDSSENYDTIELCHFSSRKIKENVFNDYFWKKTGQLNAMNVQLIF